MKVFGRPMLWCASLLAGLVLAPTSRAQVPPSPLPLSNVEDARTLPKGTVMLRALNAWTRFDAVYDSFADSVHNLHPLGNAFSADSLGVRQFTGLAPAQVALRNLTGNQNLALDVGQQFSTADAQIVTTPLSLAYGLTDRLTIGATVPIVQTHTTVFVELNPKRLGQATGANVGPNPAQLGGVGSAAAQQNTNLINQLNQAHADLAAYIANCNASGTCSQVQLSQARAASLQDSLAALGLQFLNGSGSSANAFAPFGSAADSIRRHLSGIADTVNTLLGTTYAFGSPAFAQGPAALLQLQQLARATPGVMFDSLGSPDRIGIGDVEVSALFKLVDSFADTMPGTRLRATLRGVVRLPTGVPPTGTVPFEIGTGTGQLSADGGAIVDMRRGRFVATLGALYTAYFTSANYPRLPNDDYALFPLDAPIYGTWREGNAFQFELTPRLQLTDYFLLRGAYALRHQAPSKYTSPDISAPPLFESSTEQRAGFGFEFSTVARYARGRSSVPFDVFYTHLETITATGGLTPKYSREQVEVRIYYRLRRGR